MQSNAIGSSYSSILQEQYYDAAAAIPVRINDLLNSSSKNCQWNLLRYH